MWKIKVNSSYLKFGISWWVVNSGTSKVLEKTTVLLICQGDNLVGGRIDNLLKVDIALSK